MCRVSRRDEDNYVFEEGSALPKNEFTRSPYRRKPSEQYVEEPGVPLQELSCDSSQFEHDSVDVVRELRGERRTVYDIQVEGCGNFFGKYLFSNCWLVDDPYGSPKEAHSPGVNADIRKWHSQLLIPRLTPKSNLVILYHRFHNEDYAGWLESEGGWELIRYSALADADEPADPLGRALDEPLAPNRFTWEYLNNLREKDPIMFYGLYQGKPENPEGNAVKRNWFPLQGDYDRDDGTPAFDPKKMMGAEIYFDVGASSKGDETVGTLGCAMPDNTWTWLWQVTGQWNPAQRNEEIVKFCKLVNDYIPIVAFLEEGVGLGKESVDRIVMAIRAAGLRAQTVRSVGSKWERANNRQDSFRGAAQAQRIRLYEGNYMSAIGLFNPRAAWIEPYLREVTQLQIKSTENGVKLIGKDNKWDSGTGLHNALIKLSTPTLTLADRAKLGKRFRM